MQILAICKAFAHDTRRSTVKQKVDKPSGAVVVYDGNCPFCRRQVAQIRHRDIWERFEYAAKQSPGLDERFPVLARGEFSTGMRLVMPDGEVCIGADAIYEIASQLPNWRWIAWLYRVPGIHALARLVYAWVAANRTRLGRSCDDAVCEIPAATPGGADEVDGQR